MSNVRRLENPSEAGAGPMPDAPGLWLIGADPESTPGELWYEAVTVYQGRSGLLVSGRTPNRVDQNPYITWLAPIPGPAVLAALAACEAAELAWANGDLDDELLERAVTNAESRLYAAMRAERDGAA